MTNQNNHEWMPGRQENETAGAAGGTGPNFWVVPKDRHNGAQPVRLLLVRHGRTDWNLAGRWQGHADVPLNTEGAAQAQALGRWLARRGERLQAVYCSDLQRARRTAEIVRAEIADYEQIPLIEDERLRELSFGAWEGLTYHEIQAIAPDFLLRRQEDPEGIAPPGGETLAHAARRVRDAYASITAAHPGETALIVSHGGPLRMLIIDALGIPISRIWQIRLENTSLTEMLVYPEGAILHRLNTSSHLEAAA